MEILALVAVFVVVYLAVSKLMGRKKRGKVAPAREEAWVEQHVRERVSKILADRLGAEDNDVRATLDGNPDPELVSRIEKEVARIEVVFERALDAKGFADLRVEVSFESGALERTIERLAWDKLPPAVREELDKNGAAHAYRSWELPWQR